MHSAPVFQLEDPIMTTPEMEPFPPAPAAQTPAPVHAEPPAPIRVPLSMTEHAAVGAWASLTFGAPGKGVIIEHEGVGREADFVVGVSREGVSRVMPFARGNEAFPGMTVATEGDVARTMSPCLDEFTMSGGGAPTVTLRVYTPHAALPNPKRSGNLQYATAPGVLIDLLIDNSDSDSPATAFVGMDFGAGFGKAAGEGVRLRPVDWSSKTLVGVAESGRWALAAQAAKDEVFTVLAADAAACVIAGMGAIEPGGRQGGVAVKVAPRSTRTLTLVFAVYHQGTVTQGVEGRYLYTAYFPRIEAAANFLLTNAQKIRESCSSFDGRARSACPDPEKLTLFARAVRAYEAQTQVIDSAGAAYFAVIDKKTGCRNVIDAAADHLAWELYRNPWVIRNLFDLATTAYSYHDRVRFPGDLESPDELREGGMSFAHDFGYHTAYTPGPASAEEMRGGPSMATEELLNAVYMLTSYALLADDTPWAKTRLPFARELMTSMENRDHWDPERRTGILKAESDRGGPGRAEVTAFGSAGSALAPARGNLYIAVKTFCANMMLTTYFQNNNDLHSADYSYAFAQKTAAALVAAFDKERGMLPPNLLGLAVDNNERVIAALEPLAIPTYLGLTSTLPEYFPELFNVLKTHAETCLRDGCIDVATGSLRLASGSSHLMAGKGIAVLYVLERLFGIDVKSQCSGAWKAVEAAGIDGRAIAAALFVKPA
jgi:hypothetical protein